MSENNGVTRKRVFNGLIWRFLERICAQAVTTVVTIILARILMPHDYGAIAIISIFINLCNIFVSKGFGNALIQKKDADYIDFSTVFYINAFVTVALYVIIFALSPVIADFYEMPILKPLLRIMGLRIPCTAINSIQNAVISRELKFKKYFFATISGTVLSAGVGIYMAYAGYGAWALCGQYLTNSFIDTLVLWFTVKWRPKLCFSLSRAKGLFGYGWKLLLSSLLSEMNVELKSFVIGKVYSSADLAFFNKGKQFPMLVNTNVNESMSSVLFPAMAQKQDDLNVLKSYMKRTIQTSCYIIFPMQLGMMVTAEPFIKILLTDKWLPCVIYMQIICISYCFTPLYTANAQVLKSIGKSNKFLLASVISNVFSILVMLSLIKFGVLYVALGGLVSTVFSLMIISRFSGKALGYGLFRQIIDILPIIAINLCMVVLVYFIGFLFTNVYAKFSIQIITGVVFYILISMLLHISSFEYFKSLLLSYIKKPKVNNNSKSTKE